MGETQLEFIAKITTPDGQEISKRVIADIPSKEEFDTSNTEKFMASFDKYEQHALKARNAICEEITQAWLDEQAKKGVQIREKVRS